MVHYYFGDRVHSSNKLAARQILFSRTHQHHKFAAQHQNFIP
ncbi:hypothetical protein [Microcoleus sp. K5-D4]